MTPLLKDVQADVAHHVYQPKKVYKGGKIDEKEMDVETDE